MRTPRANKKLASRCADAGGTARKFETRVACHAHNGNPSLRVGHLSRSSMRFWTASSSSRRRSNNQNRIVTGDCSSNFRKPLRSTAAASGCAPPGGVFKTSMLPAGTTSERNSESARANAESGAVSVVITVSGLKPAAVLTSFISRNIAGKRRLCNVEFNVRQSPAKLVVARDGVSRHHFQYLPLTICLRRTHCQCEIIHRCA